MPMNVCVTCGRAFQADHERQVYCSDSCKGK